MKRPDWIEKELTQNQLEGIHYGGCAGYAYEPAVVYHRAMKTMAVHGDDVLEFIEEHLGGLPEVPERTSWSR